MRAKVEHAIGVIKCVFGFVKVRYRGLAKNAHRLFVARSEKWAIDGMDDPFKRSLGFAGHSGKRAPPSWCDQAQPTHRTWDSSGLSKHIVCRMSCCTGCK